MEFIYDIINNFGEFVVEFVDKFNKDELILRNSNVINVISKLEFYINLPLLESLILADGIVCAGFFIKDYLLLKLSEKRMGKSTKIIFEYKSDIIKRYNNLYKLDTIDRYLFYVLSYCNYKAACYVFELETPFWTIGFLSLVIPFIQNKIMRVFHGPLNYYLENKYIFVKYSLSKLIVSSFQGLHKDIDRVQNFHIFLIYNIISFDYLYTCLRNYLLITLLYFLKSRQPLYYYYKAIKTAYFFNTGYNFESQSLYDAVYLANLIVKEERWNEMQKMEVVNMLYILIDSKFSEPNSSIYVTVSLTLLQFFSLWSLVAVLPFFDFSITLIIAIFSLAFMFSFLCNVRNKIRKVATLIISYCLLLFNVNVLIVTLILISNNLVYYILGELYFFITNIRSIRKVVKAYDKKKRPRINIDITETEKEFIFVNGK